MLAYTKLIGLRFESESVLGFGKGRRKQDVLPVFVMKKGWQREIFLALRSIFRVKVLLLFL